MALRRFDHDLIAVTQVRIDRHMTAVDVGGNGLVADVGVDGIGKIERRRTARQRDEPSLRREAENLIVEEFEFGVLEKFFRVLRFEQRRNHHPQPAIGTVVTFAVAGLGIVAVSGPVLLILIERVSGNAVFGRPMHLVRSDLQFDALVARPVNGRMDRLVVVALRRRNVILEAARNGAPRRMHDAEHAVAVFDRVDDDAKSVNVG